jgi:hypothetical protein
MDLLNFLIRFGQQSMDSLKEIIALIEKITKSEDLEEQVKLVLEMLKIAVELTPTEMDDNIVDLISKLTDSPLFDILLRMIKRNDPATSVAYLTTAQVQEIETVQMQGINFLQLVSLANLVMQILKTIKKSRQATL